MSLKVLEHYASIQGEGSRTGVKTQFVRFAGCNLRCPGWPCDTQHAIEPSLYKDKYINMGPYELLGQIVDKLRLNGCSNVCFTGGEPFMQPADDLNIVLEELIKAYFTVEVFTNGTMVIPSAWLAKALINMDWKLQGSGEGQKFHDQRWLNARNLKRDDMIKFVIKDLDDLHEAVHITSMMEDNTRAQLWAGVAFGQMTEAHLVDEILARRLPWNFNTQVHKYIWDPERTLV